MVTTAEALAEYNKQHGTNYATAVALGTDLTRAALKEAWITKLREAAQVQGQIEAGAL